MKNGIAEPDDGGRTGAAALLMVFALALQPGTARAQATIGGDWRADVSAFARRVVDAGLTPGMSVAVARGDWVVYARGFGTTDMDTGAPVTGDTPFYIASTTKSFTALAVVLAAERGDLDLDAPMVRYLPGAELPDGVPRESITLRDLLEMTHGLSGNGPIVLRTAFTGQFTRPQLLELLRYHEPTGRKGTFAYNNLGYNLLGLVLEARYGGSWKEAVRREVLDPVGMDHTSAWLSRLDPGEIAMPHRLDPDGFRRVRLDKADENLHAAGGHFASARDLARYLAVHLGGGMLEGRRVLPERPVLDTHVKRVDQDRTFGPFHRFGWAWGWDLGTWEGDTLVHRFGGFAGYRSHVSFMPSHGIGVVVLVNGGGGSSPASDLVATYVYDRLLGKPDLEARYSKRLDSLGTASADLRQRRAEGMAKRRARLAPLSHPLEDYAGTYESPVLGTMTWRVVAGGLELHMGVVRSRAEVYDAKEDQLRFEVGGGGVVADFSFPEDGGPARSVTAVGETFTRVEGDGPGSGGR